MQLAPNTWYCFGDLFDHPVTTLADGTRLWTGSAGFSGSALSALSLRVPIPNTAPDQPAGQREHLQLTVSNVDRDLVDGLRGGVMTARLLRETMFCVAGADYAYDVLARHPFGTFRSKGVVCASLNLVLDAEDSRRTRESRNEVRTAYRRGLLDEARRARADFKLGIRSMLRKVEALRDSGYVPDGEWAVDVLFGTWREEPGGTITPSPVAGEQGLPEVLELQLVERQRGRGFRITDLFGTVRE